MADRWTLITPVGELELNATFSAPRYQSGDVDRSAVVRRDGRSTYQRSGDGLPTPGALRLIGRLSSDAHSIPDLLDELGAIKDAVATCIQVVRTTNSGTYTYDQLAGGPTPAVTPDGLGGFEVEIELWPGKAKPTYAPILGAFRYYRLLINSNNGGDRVGVLEFELRAHLGGPSLPLTIGGSAFASQEEISGEAAKAFDGSYAQGDGWFTDNNVTFPQHVGWDFGRPVYAGQFVVSSYTTATSTASRSVKDAEIQGSNDLIEWTTLVTLIGETGWTFGEKRLFTLDDCPPPPDGVYRFYRWTATAVSGTSVGCSELGLYVTDGGDNLLDGAGGVPDNLVDGNTRTGQFTSQPLIVTADLGDPPANPTILKVGAHYTTNQTANRSPGSWTLERSFDGGSWETLDTVSGETGWTIDEIRSYSL